MSSTPRRGPWALPYVACCYAGPPGGCPQLGTPALLWFSRLDPFFPHALPLPSPPPPSAGFSQADAEQDPYEEYDEDEDDEDEDEGSRKKGGSKSFKNKLKEIRMVAQNIQNRLGSVASMGEKVKKYDAPRRPPKALSGTRRPSPAISLIRCPPSRSLFNWSVPTVTALICFAMFFASVLLYFVSLRYLLFVGGTLPASVGGAPRSRRAPGRPRLQSRHCCTCAGIRRFIIKGLRHYKPWGMFDLGPRHIPSSAIKEILGGCAFGGTPPRLRHMFASRPCRLLLL